jgi:hypothetical protein
MALMALGVAWFALAALTGIVQAGPASAVVAIVAGVIFTTIGLGMTRTAGLRRQLAALAHLSPCVRTCSQRSRMCTRPTLERRHWLCESLGRTTVFRASCSLTWSHLERRSATRQRQGLVMHSGAMVLSLPALLIDNGAARAVVVGLIASGCGHRNAPRTSDARLALQRDVPEREPGGHACGTTFRWNAHDQPASMTSGVTRSAGGRA